MSYIPEGYTDYLRRLSLVLYRTIHSGLHRFLTLHSHKEGMLPMLTPERLTADGRELLDRENVLKEVERINESTTSRRRKGVTCS